MMVAKKNINVHRCKWRPGTVGSRRNLREWHRKERRVFVCRTFKLMYFCIRTLCICVYTWHLGLAAIK